MTNEQFDNMTFMAGDEIVVYKYLGTERLEEEYVNFIDRTVNGYKATEIKEYKRK